MFTCWQCLFTVLPLPIPLPLPCFHFSCWQKCFHTKKVHLFEHFIVRGTWSKKKTWKHLSFLIVATVFSSSSSFFPSFLRSRESFFCSHCFVLFITHWSLRSHTKGEKKRSGFGTQLPRSVWPDWSLKQSRHKLSLVLTLTSHKKQASKKKFRLSLNLTVQPTETILKSFSEGLQWVTNLFFFSWISSKILSCVYLFLLVFVCGQKKKRRTKINGEFITRHLFAVNYPTNRTAICWWHCLLFKHTNKHKNTQFERDVNGKKIRNQRIV